MVWNSFKPNYFTPCVGPKGVKIIQSLTKDAFIPNAHLRKPYIFSNVGPPKHQLITLKTTKPFGTKQKASRKYKPPASLKKKRRIKKK